MKYKSTNIGIRLFADDTYIFIHEHDPKTLKEKTERESNEIIKLFNDDQLLVNMKKKKVHNLLLLPI